MKKHLWDGNRSPRLSISRCLSSQYKDACSAYHIFGSIRRRRHAIPTSLHGILEEFKSEIECHWVGLWRDSVVLSSGGFLAFSSGTVWEKLSSWACWIFDIHRKHIYTFAKRWSSECYTSRLLMMRMILIHFQFPYISFLIVQKWNPKIHQSHRTVWHWLPWSLATLRLPFSWWMEGMPIASITDGVERWDEWRGVTWRVKSLVFVGCFSWGVGGFEMFQACVS